MQSKLVNIMMYSLAILLTSATPVLAKNMPADNALMEEKAVKTIESTKTRINILKQEYLKYPNCYDLEVEILMEEDMLKDMNLFYGFSIQDEISNTISAGIAKNMNAGFTKEECYKHIADDYEKIKYNPLVTVNGYYKLDDTRYNIVNVATLCKDRITYEWDSKPTEKEWNEYWDTKEKGLDCSGFVSWVYWNVTDEYNECLNSTYTITKTFDEIEFSELMPGDLGTIIDEGTYYTIKGTKYTVYADAIEAVKNNETLTEADIITHANHVGIYIGVDENGDALWCHCSGDANTVVIDNFEFNHYYRVIDETEQTQNTWE